MRQLTTRIVPTTPAEDRPPLNVFGTMARNPALSQAFLALGGHLLRAGLVPARERELVILRTGWRSASEYEFGQHTVIGLACGLTDVEVAALAGAEHAWAPDDAALVALVDELVDDDVVSDDTWTVLAGRWSDEQLLELLVLAGYYRLVSGVLTSAGVALEPGTPGWPAGTLAPLLAPREPGTATVAPGAASL